MKKIIFTGFAAAALILAAVSCQREEFEGGRIPGASSGNLVPMTITASLEADTKAALQSDGKVFWESGDVLTVMAVDESGNKSASYEFSTGDEGAQAGFTGLVDEETAGLSAGWYAVYPPTTKEYHPYVYGTSYSGFQHTVSSDVLKMFLPSTQFAATDASGLYSLTAGRAEVDEENNVGLTMKNVGGLMAITLPDQQITSVTLYGNKNEQLAGVVTATFDEDGIPVVSSVAGSNMIRIVPSMSGSAFAAGTYYINVPPMTFETGLTLVLTNKNSEYATLKSTSAFVVERSKVSQFPAVPELTFGGKYLDFTFSNDYTVDSGTTTPFKYDSGDGQYNVGLPSSGSDVKGQLIVSNGTYQLKLNASSWIRSNTGTSGGLCLCGTAGTYVAFPSIKDFVLNKVSVRSGNMTNVSTSAGQCVTTTPDSDNKYEILPGCSAVTVPVYGGMDNIWSFSGDSYTGDFPIALTTTGATNSNSGLRFQAIRLYYTELPESDYPSVNPLITELESLEPKVDYTNMKITFAGAFSAIDYSSLSQFTCGFDYRLATDSEWTSITCKTSAFEFISDEISPAVRGEYIYKPWVRFVKKDGSAKTVYGEEASVDMSRIILSMVFDDPYYDENGKTQSENNFLTREWGWKSNTNNSSGNRGEDMNNKTYNYSYRDVDYPFTFWSVQGSDDDLDDGGYCLRVVSDSKATYGLCMNYINSNITGANFTAWMQLPGIDKFRLVNVSGTLDKNYTVRIVSSVDPETGAITSSYMAEHKGAAIMDMNLKNPEASVRYYLHTSTSRVTIRNMTLTYEYAGE